MDQGVDFDAKDSPRQLRLALMKENPKWKLPERRVARYLKKQLKARDNPKAEEIDVDIEEETVYTNISKSTKSTTSKTCSTKVVPSSIVCIREDEEDEGKGHDQDINKKLYADDSDGQESLGKNCFELGCVIS